MMTQTVLLGDIAIKIGSGATPRGGANSYHVAGPYALIRSQNVRDGAFDYNGLAYISKDQADKLKNVDVQQDDILVNITGDSVARVGRVPKGILPARVNQHVAIIRSDKQKADPKFLYYSLIEPRMNRHLLTIASTGATRNALTKIQLEKLRIELPDLETQKKIANTLGTIDEKIELNRRINETMEQMGQALFKKYFTNNPRAENWEYGVLSDLVNIYSGFAFKRTDFDPDGKFGLVTIKNVRDGSFVSECSDRIAEVPSKVPSYVYLQSGEILLSLTGNVGRVCIVNGKDLLLNQRVAKLEGKNGNHSFTYFMFRQPDFKDKLISLSRGTAQLNLSPVETKNMKIKLPPQEIQNSFYEKTETMFKTLTENYAQIETLTNLRNSLLPRLITGKIKV